MRRAGGRLGVLLLSLLVVPRVAAGYEEAKVVDGGSLAGRVRFAGTAPRLDPRPVTRHRDVCGERQAPEALVVGPEGGVKWSVIRIEGVTRGKRGGGDAVLDADGCRFVPHVLAVAPGGHVVLRNSDPVVHNLVGRAGAAPMFNVALPVRGQVVDVGRHLARPGVVRVLCEMHPHMEAWIVVHDSPYVAVTDAAGHFRIDDIPPGTHRVSLWHEGFRPRRAATDGRPVHGPSVSLGRTVVIPPRAGATVELDLR